MDFLTPYVVSAIMHPLNNITVKSQALISIMNNIRHIAFGYSTKCNIKCDHCVAADDESSNAKMPFDTAKAVIEEMATCNVTGISFTAGEPLLLIDDIKDLLELCRKHGIYSRVVTNGYWAGNQQRSDNLVSKLLQNGLSQLRISCSRWHQQNIKRENIVNAVSSCRKYGLDYFISFVTDFTEQDNAIEQFLRDNRFKFFPEPLIYSGRAKGFNRSKVFTDFPPNRCVMNPYLSPELDMFACCDAGTHFTETGFFYLGNYKDHHIDDLFRKKEKNRLYNLIRTMGLTNMASYIGINASEIVKYRKCQLCEKLFNSPVNLRALEDSLESGLLNWTR
jgi:MoaA/NifB/PqqE/SkfB family radical SAM enzyme